MIRRDELGIRYYNLHNSAWEVWHTDPQAIKTVGEKISAALTGRKRDPEVVARHAEHMRQLWTDEDFRAAQSENRRLAWDDERRAKQTARTRGVKCRPRTDEERRAISDGMKNQPPFSDERRAAISRASTGRRHSPETLTKLAARVKTPAHCAKISAAKRGVAFTPEHRAALSEAAKMRRR